MALSVDISDMNTEYNAIRVVASLDQIQETVNAYIFGVSAVCAGVLLLLVVTGLYFIRSIVRPIKQINATTKQYAKGDFSVRISENSSDEIGDLCVSINQMADELSNTENMKNELSLPFPTNCARRSPPSRAGRRPCAWRQTRTPYSVASTSS